MNWSLMMTAEENRWITNEQLMLKGRDALYIDMDMLDRRATREHRERSEKIERRTAAAATGIAAAAGRGRGRGAWGGGGGGGRGTVIPFAGRGSSAGGLTGGSAPGRAGVRYCIDAVCYHLLGRVAYDGKPVLVACTRQGKGCQFEHTLPKIPCEPAEKADLLVTAEYVKRSPQKYNALIQVMAAPTFSK